MKSAEEFMKQYLHEKEALNEAHWQLSKGTLDKFCTADYVKSFQEWHEQKRENPEAFLSVETSGESAQAITTALMGMQTRRHRYHLRKSGDSWLIFEKETECFVCRGSGSHDRMKCDMCDGIGWVNYWKQSRK